MSHWNRREFTQAALATLGTAAWCPCTPTAETPAAELPTVRWGTHDISRVLVGHNPLKGQSHFSGTLNREMQDWFSDPQRGLELLRRCEQLRINTCQMGGLPMETLLQAHRAAGGRLQWIATFYSAPGKGKDELARLLKTDPKPIGIQHFGNTSDFLMRAGKIDQARDTLKMFRDAGVLVGMGSHNHEVIDYVESQGWDVDFYQCCFYRVSFSLHPTKGGEVFEEEARQAMVRTIQQVSKPCLAFKVLGANRHCRNPESVEAALQFAVQNIKRTDVVLLGMWQKHRDQVAENLAYLRKAWGLA
jgi:hypothetical protein